ncbi:cytochrome c biogenesis CcdA family protein [Dactylosporangium sp. NPDC050588]|uniref:cytochrome c biogenesis CcdA family protein n=1 Tax=Dactylosporangium sp. NPDC050588 TaxID=3157211 RepID=UPI0033C9B7C1
MAVALLAGLVSFLSPCVLPLVPGYLSYVTGLAATTLPGPRPVASGNAVSGNTASANAASGSAASGGAASGSAAGSVVAAAPVTGRGRMLAGACLFVAGFTLVFLLTGVTFAQAGRLLWQHARTVEVVAGALTVALGLAFAGLLPRVPSERRLRFLPRAGLAGAPILGATFGLGWVPCVSPTLGAVLSLAAVDATVGRGLLLAAAYCAGLGLPFLAVAVGMRRGLAFITATRPYRRAINVAGGVMLMAVGLALLTGAWTGFIIWLRVTVGPGVIGI